MSDIVFGTGGWRAIIGDDFIRENVNRVAQAISEILIEDNLLDKPVMIGYDRRFLSEPGARWLAEVFAANGIDVLMMKRSAPSPLIMHTVQKLKLHCGIEVTASHNPPEYDGVKVIVEEGRDASVEVTDRIEKYIARGNEISKLDFNEAVASGKVLFIKNPF